MGQSERASELSNSVSYGEPEVATTKALVAAVMAAVAAGDTVAARAAAKGLLAYLEALPGSTGTRRWFGGERVVDVERR